MDTFLKSALHPFARLCLRRGIPIQKFFEAAKHAFITAAKEELSTIDSKSSTSRIAAMTGLQRKEISRINEGAINATSGMHALAKILGVWTSDKRFADKRGNPRKLSLSPHKNEFATLVESVTKDLSPYTALFELERSGAILREGSAVKLLEPTLQITARQEEALALFAEDFDRLTESLESNVFDSPTTPDLHARTEFDNIAPLALPKIRNWILEQGAKFHTELRGYLSRFDRDLNPALDKSPKRIRVSVGTFCAIAIKSSSAAKRARKI